MSRSVAVADRARLADHRERVRALLDRGAPWDACDAFREGGGTDVDDASWLFLGALAHARAGAEGDAHALLDRAARATGAQLPENRGEILALRGRLWKDALHRAAPGPAADALARRARDEYLAAYAIARDSYPGVNAATLSMVLGEVERARALAFEIEAALAPRAPSLAGWDLSTLAETALLRGDPTVARERYAAAWRDASRDAGRIASARRQLVLLARVMPEAAGLLPAMRAPDVVAFTGHMLDGPGRLAPRFPASLVPAVASALRECVAAWHAPVVYTSAACGADLLFVDAALAAGAEVNVVLPFSRDDFVRTSVAGGGEGWVARFDDALARAARVIYATEEGYLGDDILYRQAAYLVEGLAILRAAQLETRPALLAVLDAGSAGAVGGTRDAVDRWRQDVGPIEVVDLARLREAESALAVFPPADPPADPAADPPADPAADPPADPPADPAADPPADPPADPAADPATAPPDSAATAVAYAAGGDAPAALRSGSDGHRGDRAARVLKALVFADFAGYSRISDANVARFQQRFWSIAARAIDAADVAPDFANTWGDGLYLVFDAPRDAAAFALELRSAMHAVDWRTLGLPEGSQIRIGLNAGPVFRGFDPVIGRDNYYGASVTRAARIEPVTPPGTVFASEAFAATLAATGSHGYAIEYVGRVGLAKGYGEARVYRLAQR